jgi:cytochrome c oxidase subunit IV
MDAAHMTKGKDELKEPGGRSYVVVWLVLMIMTALTVTAAGLDLGGIAIVICLAIAAFKSTLVLLYFMHLRYEDRQFIKLLMPIAIATLAIFIGLTYSDVIFR